MDWIAGFAQLAAGADEEMEMHDNESDAAAGLAAGADLALEDAASVLEDSGDNWKRGD